MTRRWTEAEAIRAGAELQPTFVTAVRRPKYGNHRVEAHGYTFDSKAEAAHYWKLYLMQRAGEISELQVHPKFDFIVNGHDVGHYTGDFGFRRKGQYVVQDVKQMFTRTTAYRLRKKLMLACHGIAIEEVPV